LYLLYVKRPYSLSLSPGKAEGGRRGAAIVLALYFLLFSIVHILQRIGIKREKEKER
jgi:hypothetical protein